MRYRCSWCKAKGIKTEWQNSLPLPKSLPPGTVSDGICEKCSKEMDREIDKKIKNEKGE